MPRGVINKNVERSNFQLRNRFKWSHFAGPFHYARVSTDGQSPENLPVCATPSPNSGPISCMITFFAMRDHDPLPEADCLRWSR
jgi:hypothetical protein